MIRSVLVICQGNICRSPMAEGLLREALPGWSVQSAGLGALIGEPADPIAVGLLAERGVNISAHRAQQLTIFLADQADLILVMDSDQKADVQRQYPQVSGKVFRLGEAGNVDIPDPYFKPRQAFEQVFELIQQGIGAWVNRLRALG
ncbi:low molecular weight protein-tyrosine-phosphatase [Cupriavidus oxalaticus]|uniref:protein-tyrosine-phosphatase n=1 Tax=Cupriavidus oxalaticus TaxID=96344 RepID=A0A4P7LSN8_9BURK|nr:low molecular weight protein-tyrosine-phosphatase [Cupriavidus oxalaticus]QBY55511.1 low molecular weight phosphotyrosine protein phosphatase [Cupriavidus oxalaticus]